VVEPTPQRFFLALCQPGNKVVDCHPWHQ
jgi:hypothetical protein